MMFLKSFRQFMRTPIFSPYQSRYAIRTLFTNETLDLTTYKRNRQSAENNVEHKEQFKWELKCYMENVKPLELTQLKNACEILVYLITSNPDDMNLIKQTLYNLKTFDDLPSIAKHTIGNLIVRGYHTLNDVENAIQLVQDPQVIDFFNGFRCTFIYFDLLYRNGKYNEILSMNLKCREMYTGGRTLFSKFIDVLVFGACYNLVRACSPMNTPESFEYAYKLWQTVGESNQFKRSVAFMAALALNQNKPAVALNISQLLQNDCLVEQIKLLALAEQDCITEVIELLSDSWFNEEKLLKRKLCKEVINKIEECIEKSGAKKMPEEFQLLHDKLVADNRITDETLHDVLNRPMSSKLSVRGRRGNSVEQDG